MNIFSILKKAFTRKRYYDSALFYHEDDYCQIELSPIENLPYFGSESKEIAETANRSSDGHGFKEIHVRRGSKLELEERKISPTDLEKIIQITGLPKATSVLTGYGQSYREKSKNTIGFGKDYNAVYFDFKDAVVQHIWFTNPSIIDKEKLSECLFQLGKQWNLVLMDWNELTPINLNNKSEIEKYLT